MMPTAPSGSASQAQVGALIEQTARAHGWNPAFVKAIAWQESGWNNNVVSSAGAVGIMQVLPATGQWVSTYLAGQTLNLADPADNVLAGVLFLDYLHRMTGGDVRLILGGYYQGLRSMRDNGVYGQTERYIDNVMALRERF
jgi:soluble lytic murein transglycosylase-like protein